MKAVILFHSTNHALWAEAVLTSAGVGNRLISVPRELSSDCGYCVQIDASAQDQARDLLANEKIEFDKIVEIEGR